LPMNEQQSSAASGQLQKQLACQIDFFDSL
jgi:hypothetical protein